MENLAFFCLAQPIIHTWQIFTALPNLLDVVKTLPWASCHLPLLQNI
jgi:hypothetical protein